MGRHTQPWSTYDRRRPRSSLLTLRLTEEERQYVRDAARKAGMPINGFVLHLVEQQEKKQNAA